MALKEYNGRSDIDKAAFIDKSSLTLTVKIQSLPPVAQGVSVSLDVAGLHNSMDNRSDGTFLDITDNVFRASDAACGKWELLEEGTSAETTLKCHICKGGIDTQVGTEKALLT